MSYPHAVDAVVAPRPVRRHVTSGADAGLAHMREEAARHGHVVASPERPAGDHDMRVARACVGMDPPDPDPLLRHAPLGFIGTC